MSNQTMLVTGAGGFIGSIVARFLLSERPDCRVILTDCATHPRIEEIADKTEFVKADLTDPADAEKLVTPDTAAIFHFAGMVSGGAEEKFELGYAVNVKATWNLLEACRKSRATARFVFTSTIAGFGGADLPEDVDDWTFQHPQSSYGAAKVMCEQLLNDYSRRGFADGRGVRLAATVVRPDPHAGLSCCTSALVREPVSGVDYVCPLSPKSRIPILSANKTAAMLVGLSELDSGRLGDYRVINGPSISPRLEEIAEAVRNSGADRLGAITFEPQPEATAIVNSWPSNFLAGRANELGFTANETIEGIVADYIAKKR